MGVLELMGCIRSQISGLISGVPDKDMAAMELGLAHSLSRYKLKFSPDKIDTMIVQAVSLLDDLDKELNNYIMRSREWYGWHFPEMGKVVTDNLAYVRTVQKMGMRVNCSKTDLSDILPEDVEEQVKEAAEISMGTEISEVDLLNIKHLCEQVVEIQEYRDQLYNYLKNRMVAVAPNLTVLVGELVGARLISHAGSLMNLAKHPASTVQILGAEKALFKALKTKHDTPKYGLIYHAQLVGQSATALKGKVSRMLAAKAPLACRVDALGEDAETSAELGMEQRMKIEARIRQLEGGHTYKVSGTGKQAAKHEKFEFKSEVVEYKAAADNTLNASAAKRKLDETGDAAETPEKKKKKKKDKVKEEPAAEESAAEKPKKKKKKSKDNGEQQADDDGATTPKKAKTEAVANGDSNGAAAEANGEATNGTNGTASAKKKKKKDKKKAEEAAEA